MYLRNDGTEGYNNNFKPKSLRLNWLELIQVFVVHSKRQLRVLSNSLILGQYANPSQDYTPGSVSVPILPHLKERWRKSRERQRVVKVTRVVH